MLKRNIIKQSKLFTKKYSVYIANEIKVSNLSKRVISAYFSGRVIYTTDNIIIKEICKTTILNNYDVILSKSDEIIMETIYKIIITNDHNMLRYLPEKLRRYEFYKYAINCNWRALEYVPLDLHTTELYELAISYDGRAMQFIPLKMRTKELCELAISQNLQVLQYTVSILKIKQMYNSNPIADCDKIKLKVIHNMTNNNNQKILEFIPLEMQTDELNELCQILNTYKKFISIID